MCSILAILDLKSDPVALRSLALRLSRLQRHRGPDWSGVVADDRAILAHERLAIVDLDHGAQPIVSDDEQLVLAVNGEIYNHRRLEAALTTRYHFRTRSDCEVICAAYRESGTAFLDALNGIFAFVLWDRARGRYLIARDPIGVIPLFMGHDEHGNFLVASEMKALAGVCRTIEDFPPGHYLDSEVGRPVAYYRPAWRRYDAVRGRPVESDRLRLALEHAVHDQLMSDVPYGVLLSGGLDSSLVAATAQRFARIQAEDRGAARASGPRLDSFAIGLEGSPDLAAARLAAEAIGSAHHEVVYTVQEGLDALADVIYHIESYDVTTVRASTPMYLLARWIRARGIKMVLTGEGADEVFGGYLYFHHAPSAAEFHAETIRKLDLLHKYDCLRANKSMAAWGVEARVPFLDRNFLDVAMSFDAAHKMVGPGGMEKQVLRQAFAGCLPDPILWRQKEQFSDGVGYGWIEALKRTADERVSETELRRAGDRFPVNTPTTKEGYWYRAIFESHFPQAPCAKLVPAGPSVACSTPAALAWHPAFTHDPDPSGRRVSVHHATTAGAAAVRGADLTQPRSPVPVPGLDGSLPAVQDAP